MRVSQTEHDVRVCVVLPTYNNARTLLDTIASIKPFVTDIIVVNDGCSDETSELLTDRDDVDVVAHEVNLGKGTAIISGFTRAQALGFTHAITMDTDGQHDSADLPVILEAVREDPDCLVIGCRDLSGEGRARKSRILRRNSNFWTWAVTGHWIDDTQSGFRSYPLESVSEMHFRTTRYDFEIEILVFAVWNDVSIRSVPVKAYYGPGSESHFRPVVDFLRVTRLYIHFLLERILLTKPILGRLHTKSFREGTWSERLRRFVRTTMLQDSVTPFQFSACVGLGVFSGVFPVWGFQSILALFLAGIFGLSRTLTLLASNISFPITMPVILYFSLWAGHVITTGNFDFELVQDSMPEDWKRVYAIKYLVGSGALACIAGLCSTLVTYVLLRVTSMELHRNSLEQ